MLLSVELHLSAATLPEQSPSLTYQLPEGTIYLAGGELAKLFANLLDVKGTGGKTQCILDHFSKRFHSFDFLCDVAQRRSVVTR